MHNLLPQNVYAFLVRIHFIVIISMAIFNKILTTAAAKSLQSCLTLCDPIDGSLPGSSAHGIFQARVLEWGAIAFSEFSLHIASKTTIQL